MSHGTSDLSDSSVPRSSNGQTGSVRDRFESAWKSARSNTARPRLEDFLATIPEPERAAALRALLAVELKCRHRQGEEPTQEEYYQKFPDSADLVRSVFEESAFPESETNPTVTFDPNAKPQADFSNGSEGLNGDAKEKTGSTEELNARDRRRMMTAAQLPNVPGYQVLRKLGEGGMGIVYKARDLELKRLVALKMIRPSSDFSPELMARFRVEAAVVARLEHDHIVKINKIGSFEGKPYFELELLEGGSLHRQLAGTPQPAGKAARLVETLTRAMAYAHQHDIVHRDLKPSNILLTADGIPKITDFGLAKQLNDDSSRTQDGIAVGTPSYMAPEQAWGRNTEVRFGADLYALGVILYEMLTGRPPFKGATKEQTLDMVRNDEPVPPRQLVPQVPRDLELICLKCLRKDPHDRFATALGLADELRRFQEGRPIRTRPTPFWERGWKWAKRKPAVATLMAVSVMALVISLLYFGQMVRHAQERIREVERISKKRDEVHELRQVAQAAYDKEDLNEAQISLSTAFGIVQSHPSLSDMGPPLGSLQEKVTNRTDVQKAIKKSEELYTKFFDYRDTALFHGMVFTGVDLPTNLDHTMKACEPALKSFGVELANDASPVFPKYLTEAQQRQVALACYELLLIWGEAKAQSKTKPGQDPKQQAADAIQCLDRASRLNLPRTRAYHLRRAGYLELLGQAGEAARQQQLAAAIEPKEALDHFLTGISHQQQGKQVEATQNFSEAISLQPDHFWAWYFLGVCNLQLKQPAQARDNFTICLAKSQKDFLWLYLLRGFANEQLKNYRAAETDYQQALRVEKKKPDPQARYTIMTRQGVVCLRQVQMVEGFYLAPLGDLYSAIQGASEVCRRDRLNTAAVLLTQAKDLQPKQYPAYRELALVYQQQRKFGLAVKALDKAIEVAEAGPEPTPTIRAQLYGQRARLNREWNKPDAAIADLSKALDLVGRAEDYLERGRLRHLRKDYANALEDYDAALKNPPVAVDVYRFQADALRGMQREAQAAKTLNPKTAAALDRAELAALTRYLQKGGKETAAVYRQRGALHAELRQYADAQKDFSLAIDLKPDSATYMARGWVHLIIHADEEALKDFEESIRLDEKNADAYFGSALIRAKQWSPSPKQGLPIQAIAEVKKALDNGRKAGGNRSRMMWNAAHVYAQLAGAITPALVVQYPTFKKTRGEFESQALKQLKDALDELPATERRGFWDRQIASDKLLDPIRNHPGFKNLEPEVRKPR